MSARRAAADRMARVCVALTLTPAEYRTLTLAEVLALLEEVNRRNETRH